jgi:transposase, IS4 family
MSKPKPARYRTTNWSAYNAALRSRGSLLIPLCQGSCHRF